MKNLSIVPVRSIFSVTLVCFIDFGSASCVCCLLRSIGIILYFSLEYINLVSMQMYSDLLDHWNFFKCFHMFCITINWLIKNVCTINFNIVTFYFYLWKVISCRLFSVFFFSSDDTNIWLTPWKLVLSM